MFGRIQLWDIWFWIFVGSNLITSSISLLVIGLFRFSVSSWVSLRRLYFSRNVSIPSRLSNLLAYYFSWNSLIILWISVVSVVFIPFLFLILFIGVLCIFFLITLAMVVVYFIYLLKEPALGFTDFFLLFYSSLFYLFLLWSYYVLPYINSWSHLFFF